MKDLFSENVNDYDKIVIKTIDGKQYDYQNFLSFSITYNEDFIFVKSDEILKAYCKSNVLSVALFKLNSFEDMNYPNC